MELKDILKELQPFVTKALETRTDDLIKILPPKKDTDELFELARQLRDLHFRYEGHQIAKKYHKQEEKKKE